VYLLHVLGDFQSPQALDLPLWGAGPYRIGPPDHMIGAKALDQRAHQRGRKTRFGDTSIGKQLSEVAIDIPDAVFTGNIREVADP
jgi:hypothetical protein